jgi:glycosyltransferase involved in cell wall biosynthesis
MNSVKPLSVARVIARLNIGGPAIQAILMTNAMRRKGYKALLLTGEVAPGEASMEYLADAVDVSPIKINSMSRRISFLRDLTSLWVLIRIFRRERPTIVHTHTAKAGTVGRIAAVVARVPIRVHTFHGHVFNGYFSPLATRVFLTIERLLAKCTDCIVAISDSQQKELVELYRIAPEDKVVTIPLGFDLEPFLSLNGRTAALRAEVGGKPGQPMVGWIGRLTAIKSPHSLIDCASLLAEHATQPCFVIVGDGELRQECQTSIQQAGLGKSVHMLGWRRDLPSIYSGLDFVMATSLSEGTPVALLEAMASGKAVVSTDVGGVRDLMVGAPRNFDGMEVFENGILVGCDAQKLAKAVEYLVNNPSQAQAMGRKGREFVASRFSHLRLADDLEGLYQSLAKTKLHAGKAVPAKPDEVEVANLSTDKVII